MRMRDVEKGNKRREGDKKAEDDVPTIKPSPLHEEYMHPMYRARSMAMLKARTGVEKS